MNGDPGSKDGTNRTHYDPAFNNAAFFQHGVVFPFTSQAPSH